MKLGEIKEILDAAVLVGEDQLDKTIFEHSWPAGVQHE
jgi:hypothetical protein